jgi:hypothetical protein
MSGRDSLKIWRNHQVLAYSYSDISATTIDINIYDPNYPQRDDVIIQMERVPVGTTLIPGVPPRKRTVLGFKCCQKIGDREKKVRGFFCDALCTRNASNWTLIDLLHKCEKTPPYSSRNEERVRFVFL